MCTFLCLFKRRIRALQTPRFKSELIVFLHADSSTTELLEPVNKTGQDSAQQVMLRRLGKKYAYRRTRTRHGPTLPCWSAGMPVEVTGSDLADVRRPQQSPGPVCYLP